MTLPILPINSDVVSKIPVIGNILSDHPIGRNNGEKLKISLGLENYPYVMIQHMIDVPISMYLVSYDSRRPTLYLSPFRVKTIDSTVAKRIKRGGMIFVTPKVRLTPAMPIERTEPIINKNTIIIVRDISGEYLMNTTRNVKVSESVEYTILDYNYEEVETHNEA